MRRSLRKLFLVTACAVLLAHPLSGQSSDWQVLKAVPAGQRIRVSLRDGASREGAVKTVSDSGITMDAGEAMNKDDVRRVWLKRGSHRGKHALIGAGVGAAIGLGTGAAIDADCSPNAILCTGPYGKAILTPAFALVGAGVGALLPARGWQEVYRAK